MENSKSNFIYEWFVKYNPIYLISVVCLLSGIVMVSEAIETLKIAHGEILLTVVSELYQFLLLFAVYFLKYQLDEKRSSNILSIISVFLFGDLTYQIESMTNLGIAGYISSSIWIILFGLKFFILFRIHKIQISKKGHYLILFPAVFVVLLPHLLVEGIISSIHYKILLIVSFFSAQLFYLIFKPKLIIKNSSFSITDKNKINCFFWIILNLLMLNHHWVTLITFNQTIGSEIIIMFVGSCLIHSKDHTLDFMITLFCLFSFSTFNQYTIDSTLLHNVTLIPLLISSGYNIYKRYSLFTFATFVVILNVFIFKFLHGLDISATYYQAYAFLGIAIFLSIYYFVLKDPKALIVTISYLSIGIMKVISLVNSALSKGVIVLASSFLLLILGVVVSIMLKKSKARIQ